MERRKRTRGMKQMAMKMWQVVLFALVSLTSESNAFRLAFGSCNNVNQTQALWDHILAREPDAWLWGGDNIYADFRPRTIADWMEIVQKEPARLRDLRRNMWYPATEEKLKYLYNKLKAVPGYQALVKKVGKENVIGIWDDHDYGLNDFGKHLQVKEASQQAFLDFFDVPADDVRRSRPGIYSVKDFANGKVRVVMLDNRYFRDDYDDKTGDILGEAQWQWLEKQLEGSSADFTLIVSGVQVLPDHPYRSNLECWNSLPRARARLFETVQRSQARGVFFVSGDVHFAEFQLANCTCRQGKDVFHLPEVTSSGMTHSWDTYPALVSFAMEVAQNVMTFQYNWKQQWFLGRNFGELDFAGLGGDDPTVTWRIFDKNGTVRLEQEWHAHQLKPAGSLVGCECVPNKGKKSDLEISMRTYLTFAIVALPPLAGLALLWMICSLTLCRSRPNQSKTKSD